jgi:invasion protein IalB
MRGAAIEAALLPLVTAKQMDASAPRSSGMNPFLKWALIPMSFVLPASAQDSFSSPAIDPSIYRDGAIENIRKEFDSWTAICREVKNTRQRVCNLVSQVVNVDGAEFGTLVLATDDQGKPAMMLELKAPIVVSAPVKLQTQFPAKENQKSIKVPYQSEQGPLICARFCKYVFYAEPKLIFSLNEGNDVVIAFLAASPSDVAPSRPLPKGMPVRLIVHGKGFAAALQASLAN